jgi:hypothetical protein
MKFHIFLLTILFCLIENKIDYVNHPSLSMDRAMAGVKSEADDQQECNRAKQIDDEAIKKSYYDILRKTEYF